MKKPKLNIFGNPIPTNEPEEAFENLKEDVRKLGKDDTLILFNAVPKNVETWLKRICKKKGISLHFGSASYRYSIITVEDRKREKEEADRRSQFWEDYFNSPG